MELFFGKKYYILMCMYSRVFHSMIVRKELVCISATHMKSMFTCPISFALRTEEQAEQSRISKQSHGLEDMRKLLQEMALASSSMLLFLKNVECIELYDWKADSHQPTLIHRTHVSNITDKLRMKRSYMLHAPTSTPRQPQPVDYILDITNDDLGKDVANMLKNERWIVCNQLGGPEATKMAQDPALSHMKLIP